MEPKDHLFIHIIESPSPDDFLSNRLEGEPLSKTLKLMGVKSQYTVAVNRDTFEKTFQRILDTDFKSTIPLVHISAHGDSKGIRLTSSESLTWDILEKELIPLNKALDGYLLLFMSTCEGIYAGSMVCNEKNDLPFYAIVGNRKKIKWADTLVGFTTIYHLLGKGMTIEEAVNAARIASRNPDFHFFAASTIKKMWNLNELLKVIKN